MSKEVYSTKKNTEIFARKESIDKQLSNFALIFFFNSQGGGGLVTQLKKSYSLTDLVLTPDNDESSKFDTRSTRRALPQITDITGKLKEIFAIKSLIIMKMALNFISTFYIKMSHSYR